VKSLPVQDDADLNVSVLLVQHTAIEARRGPMAGDPEADDDDPERHTTHRLDLRLFK
jgi:hypothetical protein